MDSHKSVFERKPWHSQRESGPYFISSNELQLRQCGNDVMDPLGQGRDFCDWWTAFLGIPFIELWLKYVSEPPTMWKFCQSSRWHRSQYFFFKRWLLVLSEHSDLLQPLMQRANVLRYPEDSHTDATHVRRASVSISLSDNTKRFKLVKGWKGI